MLKAIRGYLIAKTVETWYSLFISVIGLVTLVAMAVLAFKMWRELLIGFGL